MFITFNYVFENISSGYNNNAENIVEDVKVEEPIAEDVGKSIARPKKAEKDINRPSKKEKDKNWKLEIPKIKLDAKIANGVTDRTMNKYIGHFNETAKWNGNIGLAAHNRGYPVNYFKDIKKLKKGDKIIYKYGKNKRTYVVSKSIIIEDTDWTLLEETTNNRITLITCVEDKPSLRRVVQAVEKGKKI